MGGALAFLSKLSPVKWLNDAFFALCCDHSLGLFWPVFLGAVILSACLVLGCRLFFRTEDYI
jgi:ABC-2 type transport system permease protein